MKNILFTILLTPFVGCAYLSSHTKTPIIVTVNGTNYTVNATTDVRVYTWFDANSQLTKFRNSNGGTTNTYSPGTTVAGVNESSSSSNIVNILNAAAAIAAKMP